MENKSLKEEGYFGKNEYEEVEFKKTLNKYFWHMVDSGISMENSRVYTDMVADILKTMNGMYNFVVRLDKKLIVEYFQMGNDRI